MSQSAERPPLTDDQRRGALLSVFLVVFIDLLGFGIVLPQLPLIGKRLVAPQFDGSASELWTGLLVGLLMASFSAMQFVFAPIWGRVSDRIGRRPVLIAGLAGSVVFYALLGWATGMGVGGQYRLGFALLLLARAGAGIAGATIATAQAVIADTTTPEKRSRGMALIGVAFGIGFTFGPAIGALLMHYYPNRPAIVGIAASLMSLAALAIALVRLPETLQHGTSPPARGGHSLGRLLIAMRQPDIGRLILTFFLTTFAFTQFEVTLSLFNESLGLVDQQNYLVFAGIGFTLIFATGGLYRRLAGRLPDHTLLALGVVGILAGQCGLATVAASGASNPTLLGFYFGCLFVSTVGYAFINPSVQSLISRRTDPARQGEILGVNQSAASLARVVGPAVGPPLFALGARHMLPYVLAAVLLVLVLALLSRLRNEDGTIPA